MALKTLLVSNKDISILLIALDAQRERIDAESDTDEDISINPDAYDPDVINELQGRLEALQDG